MSEKDQVKGPNKGSEAASVAMPRQPGYMADVSHSLRQSFGGAWMVTFTDLVALMLTFFVLLFSMSSVEHYKWQNLVRSLAGSLDAVQTRDAPRPAVAFQIDRNVPTPGADLDYLAPVIEEQLAAEPALAEAFVWRQDGRVILTIPPQPLFDSGRGDVAARGGASVYAISRLIQSLENRVEVHGYSAGGAGAGADRDGWALSLSRAAAMAAALRETGYRHAIVARGYGAVRQGRGEPPDTDGQASALADRIDIVILDRAVGGR